MLFDSCGAPEPASRERHQLERGRTVGAWVSGTSKSMTAAPEDVMPSISVSAPEPSRSAHSTQRSQPRPCSEHWWRLTSPPHRR